MNTPSICFWGAAQTVTGSMHLLDVGKHRILLDCGLFQGRRSEARIRNRTFPFDARRIDAVILSHAHIDHCGNLPNLVANGFHGPIYCTSATRDLMAIMLADSAKIQEEDARYLNDRRERGDAEVEPLYTRKDAHRTVRLCHSVPYEKTVDTGLDVQFQLVDAGHLLGSAMIHLTMHTTAGTRTLTFTGDLGRRALPILRDPAPVPPADLIVSESTYGGRTHEPVDLLADSLLAVVKRTVERGGKLLVPAFSLGRTQAIVYFLQQLITEGRLPEIPIFVDSPLAANATEVFHMHPECFDEETALVLEENPDLFGQRRVRYSRSVEESKRLNDFRDPCVIIAASGMCEAGRILHHLKHNIENSLNTVLIIGFQAADTLGRQLVERRPEVRILNRRLQLRAEVAIMNGFSSHADHADLLEFLGPLAGRTREVFLVHGEVPSAEALAKALQGQGFPSVSIPQRGDVTTI